MRSSYSAARMLSWGVGWGDAFQVEERGLCKVSAKKY